MVEAEGSGSLFIVFFLSLYTIVLIPYTIYKLCNLSTESKQVIRPWVQNERKEGRVSKVSRHLRRPSILVLLGLWVFFFVLVYIAQVSSKDAQPFDPYAILLLEKGATSAQVKRAYRQLSLRFHPDKNPDPEAAKYFAEFITKAYKALSDPIARKNYEEHGHPDGPQSIQMGIALPAWLLDGKSKSAPLLLAGLVGAFILLPLIVATYYLFNANKYSDGVMDDTYNIFLRSPAGVREGQGLGRILETLTIAVEFIIMPMPSDQLPAMEQLRKLTMRTNPDLKEKKAFWQRKPSCVKAGMLLLAHLEREDVPAPVKKDLAFVLEKAPKLTDAIVQLAALPRPPMQAGWLSPAIGAIEFQQHLIQAVSLSTRKNPGSLKGTVEGPAPLRQLPHFDAEVVKRLLRKRVRGLSDLQAQAEGDRQELLEFAGLSADEILKVEQALSSIPSISVTTECEVAGDTDAEIMSGDIVICRARILLSRLSHATQELAEDGSQVAAFAPLYPHSREEKWYFFVADPNTNEVLSAIQHISLLEAEYHSARAQKESAGRKRTNGSVPAAGRTAQEDNDAPNKPKEQVVEVAFRPATAAKRDYTLFAMCDSWIGSDLLVPLKIKVGELTRAEKEGRATRAARETGRVIPLDEFGNAEEGAEVELDEFGEEAEQEEGSDDEDFDSEEDSEEESGSDEEDEEVQTQREDGGESGSDSLPENQRGIVPKAYTLAAED